MNFIRIGDTYINTGAGAIIKVQIIASDLACFITNEQMANTENATISAATTLRGEKQVGILKHWLKQRTTLDFD